MEDSEVAAAGDFAVISFSSSLIRFLSTKISASFAANSSFSCSFSDFEDGHILHWFEMFRASKKTSFAFSALWPGRKND